MRDKMALQAMLWWSLVMQKWVYRLSCDEFPTLLTLCLKMGRCHPCWLLGHSFTLNNGDISCLKFLHAKSHDMEDSMWNILLALIRPSTQATGSHQPVSFISRPPLFLLFKCKRKNLKQRRPGNEATNWYQSDKHLGSQPCRFFVSKSELKVCIGGREAT